jgi:hypothetical protein
MAMTQINGGTQIQSATITQAQLNCASPTSSGQVATKAYVDAVAQGLSVKVACQCATTSASSFTIASGNVTLITGTTVDGYSPAVNDYILVKDAPASTGSGSANSSQPGNGVYIVTSNTTNLSLSRAAFMSSTGDAAQGAFTFIESGTANASSGWVVSSPAADATCTYGTTAIQWTQFSGAGEVTTANVLTKVGNQLSVSSMSTNQIILGNAGTPTITTLSGDVTVGATGAMTIGAGAVSLAKMANLAGNSVIGNNTGSSATPVAVPLSAAGVVAASTIPLWDANQGLSANTHIPAFTSTATAGATTTLTIGTATGTMVWTGSTTQTIKLPTTSVLVGTPYTIINESTGTITIQSSGGNTITTLAGASSAPFNAATFIAVVATPTTAANWTYVLFSTGGGGSVSSVSIATANGFEGSSSGGATPALTIQPNVAAGLISSSGAGGSIATVNFNGSALQPAGYIVRESVGGTVNGSNTAFTLANSPLAGTEMIFQNGILLVSGASKDYTISGTAVTFITAPATGDVLFATYWH